MNNRLSFSSILLFVLLGVMIPSAASAESFFEALLRVAGISATPSQQRGDEEKNFPGDLMVVDLKENIRRRITSGGGYRSPVFEPGDKNILALKGAVLVRIPIAGGREQAMHSVPGISKLIGFDGSDQDKLLVLLDAEGNDSPVGFLALKSGKVTALPFDRKSKEQREMLNHLKGWERVYGEVKLYPQEGTKNVMGRTIVWTDVFLQRGEEFPLNISNCDGKNCGQPSLSHDTNLVVYVAQKG
jgi:hypothetical protein